MTDSPLEHFARETMHRVLVRLNWLRAELDEHFARHAEVAGQIDNARTASQWRRASRRVISLARALDQDSTALRKAVTHETEIVEG